MWQLDGPDVLYCDGYSIWRVSPTYNIIHDMPLVISKERILEDNENHFPLIWPFKYMKG